MDALHVLSANVHVNVHVKTEETCDSTSQCEGDLLGLFVASEVPPPPPPSNTVHFPTPHLMETAMNALLILSTTPRVKTDETSESNVGGLRNSRHNMRRAITCFEMILPRLSAHYAQIFRSF